MSTLKLEHIAHIDNAGPDISIDSSGHLNIVNGNLQMGGVTMLDASNGDLSTGNNASFNIRDAAGEVAGRIRNWSSPTNSIAIESDPSNSAAGSYLTFTVDGAQKMTILGNNVGIGTTSPDTILHISSAGSPQIRVQDTTNDVRGQFTANDSNVVIGTVSNHSLNFATNNGNQVTLAGSNLYPTNNNTSQLGLSNRVWNKIWTTNIVANGNVGIGTNNPTSKLHTDGAMVSTNLAQGTGELQIQGYGSTGYINMNGSGSLIFRMGSSYSQDLKLTSAGILQGSSDAEIKTSPIRKHSNTISTNTTIDSSENAIASGPISVATGVTLTINGNMTVV